MTPSLYQIISQGGSLLSAIAAKMQQEKDDSESVKEYAAELGRAANSLLKAHSDEFTPDGWCKYENTLTEINGIASQLAEECENPDRVMHLTGGELKSLLSQFGDLLKNERPEVRGKSFWESIKERFKK